MFFSRTNFSGSRPVAKLRDVFADYSENNGDDLLTRAAALSEKVFSRVPDKGDPTRTMFNHQKSTAMRAHNLFRDWLRPERLSTVVSLAFLHDLSELTSPSGRYPWSERRVITAGFSPEFAHKVGIMRHEKSIPYLDYIRELVVQDIDCAMVKYADLLDNTSPDRGALKKPSQQLLDKHAVLYPASKAYIWAVLTGEIDPREVTVPQFVMQNPYVDPKLKDAEILAKYSSDDRQHERKIAHPGASLMRNLGSMFAQPQLAL